MLTSLNAMGGQAAAIRLANSLLTEDTKGQGLKDSEFRLEKEKEG